MRQSLCVSCPELNRDRHRLELKRPVCGAEVVVVAMVTACLAWCVCVCVFVCFVCSDARLNRKPPKRHRQSESSTFSRGAQRVARIFLGPEFKGQGLIKQTECFASWCIRFEGHQRMHKGGLSMRGGQRSTTHCNRTQSLRANLQTWSHSSVSHHRCALPPTAWVPSRCSGFLPQSGDVQREADWQLSFETVNSQTDSCLPSKLLLMWELVQFATTTVVPAMDGCKF